MEHLEGKYPVLSGSFGAAATDLPISEQERKAAYHTILAQCRALVEDQRSVVSNLANVSALLYSTLPQLNWVGFYLLHEATLLLGPFQGNTACVRIPMGRGVCGTAAAQNQTQCVEDVHAFPGHIACDSASRSELVVPLHHPQTGDVVGVLDIDSPILSRFDEIDRIGLEAVARELETACDWDCFHV